MYIQPLQKLPFSDKIKLDDDGSKIPAWIRQNANYWASYNTHSNTIAIEIQKCFDIIAGKNMEEDYKYVENPYNTKNDNYKKYPARIRNYDIIKPIIERWLGERRERPSKVIVNVNNNDVFNIEKKRKDALVKEELMKLYLTELKNAGLNVEVEGETDKEKLQADLDTPYLDKRAIRGQRAIEFLAATQDLDAKFQQLYSDFITCGYAFSHKDCMNDDVQYNVIHPTQLTVIGWDSSSRYAEDATAQVCRYYWTISTIIDKFREYLSDRQIDYLINYQKNNEFAGAVSWENKDGDTYTTKNNGTLMVQHIVWKSYTKRGILSYRQSDDTIGETIVPEDYILETKKGDISIHWLWENEWWECWRIGDTHISFNVADDAYIYYGVGKVQRTEINNTSICKLPYNGTYWGYIRDSTESLAKRGEPYLLLYNIFHFRFELTLAKNKDKLLLFPLGLIPKHKGWDTDRWFHSISAFSTIFFDETSEKAVASLQAIKSIDMGLGQYMNEMWNFMNSIRDEWWDSCGMNRQRYGDVAASDRKSVTEQAVFRSAVANREVVALFERLREMDLQGLIDYSKYAWIEGKQSMYTTSTGDRALLDVDGISHLETEYGVFVSSGIEEQNKLQTLNSLLQPMQQNGVPASVIAEVVDSQNVAKMKQLIKKGEDIQRQYGEQQAKTQQDHEKYIADKSIEKEQLKDKRERDIAQIRADTEIEKALILSDSFNAGTDKDTDGVDDSEEIVDRHYKRILDAARHAETVRANKVKENTDQQRLNLDAQKLKAMGNTRS